MELVDGLDVAEDGGEGVRVQSQGFIVPVDTAVEDLGEQIYFSRWAGWGMGN